jgi:polysaccharide chain length determinant protein (PEP-CTERM system associated)
MARNGEISVSDAKRVLRKHWWLVPTCAILLGALGYIATLVLPKKYTSTTSVLVQQPAVSADYVKSAVTDDLNMRLSSMKAQVLSNSRLQPIIEKLNLYPEERNKASMDELVGKLQKAVSVELLQPMPGADTRQSPGFLISTTFDKPQIAQQICSEITSMFIVQNTRRRMDQSQKTNEFVDKELETAKESLDQQDAKLADFKRHNLGLLPEEEQTNLTLLNGMNTQLESLTQALTRAQQDKTFNETIMNQQEASWKATLGGGQNQESMDQQLAALQDQLTSMLLRYTPQHPDVLKLKAQIDELKTRMAADPDSKPNDPVKAKIHEPAQIQQMRAKLKQADIYIADLVKRQTQLQEQIRIIQGRIQASPMVEQQYKELTRNYETAQKIYNDLLQKQSDSSIAKDLEHEQGSELFLVLDPPSLPESPSFPKVPLFLGGGFGAGIALSLAIMYLLALSDKGMYTEQDVEQMLKLPVLTTVPSFDAMRHGHASNGKRSVGDDAVLQVKA